MYVKVVCVRQWVQFWSLHPAYMYVILDLENVNISYFVCFSRLGRGVREGVGITELQIWFKATGLPNAWY